jgi:hypothetical protein
MHATIGAPCDEGRRRLLEQRGERVLEHALHRRLSGLPRVPGVRTAVVGEVDPQPQGRRGTQPSPSFTSSMSAMRALSPLRGSSLRMRV